MYTVVVFVLNVFLLLDVYSTTSDVIFEHSDNELSSDSAIPSRSKRSRTDRISSCAALSTGVTARFGLDTIVLDDVSRNDGNGYDKNNGVYTAPKTGEYTLLLTTWNVKDMDSVYIAVEATGDKHYSRGRKNNVVKVHLDKGDRVWVGGDKDQIDDPPEGKHSVMFCASFMY